MARLAILLLAAVVCVSAKSFKGTYVFPNIFIFCSGFKMFLNSDYRKGLKWSGAKSHSEYPFKLFQLIFHSWINTVSQFQTLFLILRGLRKCIHVKSFCLFYDVFWCVLSSRYLFIRHKGEIDRFHNNVSLTVSFKLPFSFSKKKKNTAKV